MKITKYKIIETQTVTDVELESIVNRVVADGWVFDGIQFAMRESSKRPSMAFITFTRVVEADADAAGESAASANQADAED